jgi:apolipoprotein D and lipocalin family protein
MKKLITLLSLVLIFGCKSVSKEEVQVVQNFDINRYTGTWYEIARLDHSFERGLEQVSANYTLNKNGTIKVVNSGYNPEKNRLKSVTGRAKFADKNKLNYGRLRVSFFWPFYGDYNIIILDNNYKYAVVTSNTKNYLWILSRDKKMKKNILDILVKDVEKMGFKTDKLIYVKQN